MFAFTTSCGFFATENLLFFPKLTLFIYIDNAFYYVSNPSCIFIANTVVRVNHASGKCQMFMRNEAGLRTMLQRASFDFEPRRRSLDLPNPEG